MCVCVCLCVLYFGWCLGNRWQAYYSNRGISKWRTLLVATPLDSVFKTLFAQCYQPTWCVSGR